MLVLTRKVGEKIVLDHPDGLITVVLVEIGGSGKVRLGFDAPDTVSIDRKEVREKIEKREERRKRV